MKTKLTALFLSLVMLVSVVSILSTVPVGALTEGDWIPKRNAKDYTRKPQTLTNRLPATIMTARDSTL